MPVSPIVVVLTLLAGLCGANAQTAQRPEPPSPANGEILARRWCAACHIVSLDQKTGSADAPTFASLGQSPALSAEWVAQFVQGPHARMPDMTLSRKEAADLAAYMRSLAN